MAPLFPTPKADRFDYEMWSHLGKRWERVQSQLTTKQAAEKATYLARIGLRQGKDYRFTA